ncbi:ice-binding family protein [Aeromicrobium wangtongii]|uniref:ice-binding family protein n=1 Tax=Aeromicrobium wangtongii TaxID=2969247 RepID=UPI002017216F|nr:ice-binding family protein [Aeromicrobium wangtongii]MCL3820349.1 ice-binding family protein [Aeromicrobium wangtongii]
MPHSLTRSRHHLAPLLAVLSAATALAAVSFASSAQAAATDLPLGSTERFAVLAGSGITNTGPTTVNGDLGSSPTPAITGSASITATGQIRSGPDGVVDGAKDDLVTAYDAAAGAGPPTALPADIGGQTLVGGVHSQAGAMQMTGVLTLDGQGDPGSVFIIQVGSDFTTATSSSVLLVNGAQACHVYWQVAGSATFGTRTAFQGNVLALTSITATTAATFNGRLLARDGAVTLDTNTITRPVCTAATTPPPTTVPTATPTATPTPSATTPAPTRSTPTATPSRRPDDSTSGGTTTDGSGDDSSGGSGSGGGFGAGTGGGSGSGGSSTGTGTGLPNAGGPSGLLAPVGAAAVLAGAALVLVSRQRRGARRG